MNKGSDFGAAASVNRSPAAAAAPPPPAQGPEVAAAAAAAALLAAATGIQTCRESEDTYMYRAPYTLPCF